MKISFEQFLNVRSAFGATFDASGRWLYFLNTATGVPNLWGLPLDKTDAGAQELAVGPERVQGVFPSARPERLVFGMDQGGNERTQLFLLDGLNSRPRALTGALEAIHHFGEWHPDGRTFCYSANLRDARYFDIYVMDVEAPEPRPLYQDDSTNRAVGFEPGGKRVLIERSRSQFEQELLLVDPADGSARLVADGWPAARYYSAHWSPDGRLIYCATDRESDFLGAAVVHPESGRLERLNSLEHDVEGMRVSPDGGRLVYSVNDEGYSRIYLRQLCTARERRVEQLSAGLCQDGARWEPIFAWSPDGRQVALTSTSATTGPDIWIIDVDSARARRVTRSSDAGLPAEALTTPELRHYPSFDGRKIPVFVFRPESARSNRAAPVLFFVHGGPANQFRPGFNPVIQYFAQRGFVVVAPNVRGSSGYGKSYSALDDLELRPDSVRDLAACAEWLAASDDVDPKRMAVMGSSYGGYMVLAALTERPDLWAAGVDIVGIANFVTFLERTGPWRRRDREAEYGSLEHDHDLLERLSPLHRVDRIVAPLMVVHGANDPRVPVSEAEQIVASLRARGREVEYLRFENEGHGVIRLENRLVAYPRIAEFLERHLLG